MTKKQVKQIFHEQGIQINNDAVEMVLEQLKKETIVMAERCKQGNFKRLSPEHFWVAEWSMALVL